MNARAEATRSVAECTDSESKLTEPVTAAAMNLSSVTVTLNATDNPAANRLARLVSGVSAPRSGFAISKGSYKTYRPDIADWSHQKLKLCPQFERVDGFCICRSFL